MNRNDEWKAQSTVTIPLEYYEWLRNREGDLVRVLSRLRDCFNFDNGAVVDVDRLVKETLEMIGVHFKGVAEFENVTYTNVDLQKVDKLRRLSENASRLFSEESKNMRRLIDEKTKNMPRLVDKESLVDMESLRSKVDEELKRILRIKNDER